MMPATSPNRVQGIIAKALLWSSRVLAGVLLVASAQAQPIIPPSSVPASTPAEAADLITALVADADTAINRTQYDVASARLTDAYSLLELAKSPALERNVLNSLATLYYSTDQLALAGQYYRKLLALDIKNGDEASQSVSYFNLGHVSASLQHFDEADTLFQQALALSQKLKDKSGIAYVNKAMGVNAQAQGQLEKAETLLKIASDQFIELKDKSQSAATLRNLGDVALARNEPQQAVAYYQQAIPLLLEAGLSAPLTRAYRGLSQAYESLQDYQSALQMQRTYASLLQADLEARSDESAQQLREELGLRHYADDNAKLEQLAANQQDQLEQQLKLLKLELLAGVLAVMVVGLLGYLLWRRGKTAKMLANLANTDSLTGVANRRAIMDSGRAEWQRSKRYEQETSVLAFDVDHFKSINDTFGHGKGDEVLQAITAVISDMMRQTDFLGRIGGEEFLLICGNTDLLQAQALAERIRVKVSELGISGIGERKVTISIGLAAYQPHLSFEQTVQLADRALYHAKQSGRNRCSVYHSGLGQVPVKTAEQPQLKLVEAGRL